MIISDTFLTKYEVKMVASGLRLPKKNWQLVKNEVESWYPLEFLQDNRVKECKYKLECNVPKKNAVMNWGKDNHCACTIYQLFKMTLLYNHFVTFCYGHSDHFDLKAFDYCDDL